MLDSNKIEEFLYQYCLLVQRKSDGWIMRCPFCGDSKKNPNMKRFHLDYYQPADKYTYFCYNGGCNESGDVYSLYAHLKGIKYSQARKELDENSYSPEKIKKQFRKKKEILTEKKKQIQNIDISSFGLIGLNSKPESKRLQRYQVKLKEFLENRKIDIKCWIATEGKFENRIIIPLFQDGKLVYIQGRRLFSSMTPKYLNPEVDKSYIIPNIDQIDINKTVIVAEGILDMYSVNINSTCCLGAYISDEFLKSLFDKVKKDVIIALDNFKIDKAAREQLNNLIKESKYGKRLKYFHMPFDDIKDLNELKQKKDIENIYQFVIDNSFSYLKTKLILNSINVGKN